MSANTLNLRRDDNNMSISYHYQTQMKTYGHEKCLIIPSPRLSLKFNLYLNGNQLLDSSYNYLIDRLGSNICRSSYWNALEVKPSLRIDNSSSFQLDLQCLIFDGIINEFIEFDSNGNTVQVFDKEVNILKEMTIDIRYQTWETELLMDDFLHDLNYMISSWLVNIEYIFPLVFSVYGRQVFKLNYTSLKRCISEMNDHQLDKLISNASSSNNHQSLILNLDKLQVRIMNEYNILNILKEIDHSNYRYKVFINNKGKTSKQTMGVKNFPYSLALIAVTHMHNDD
ncbi:hypothetical protein DFJ63DRAFT_55683 [Scheffersomyces coipomensis]|uniref:uncharacterized protein n=1 Tax=Scheffersomyces coipomensis TaxID=1788519 RepID=UPI00315E02EE